MAPPRTSPRAALRGPDLSLDVLRCELRLAAYQFAFPFDSRRPRPAKPPRSPSIHILLSPCSGNASTPARVATKVTEAGLAGLEKLPVLLSQLTVNQLSTKHRAQRQTGKE